MSSRRDTIAGDTLKSAATANVTAMVPAGNRFELVGAATNLFDVQYADPVSDQHRQDAIGRNGRALLRVALANLVELALSSARHFNRDGQAGGPPIQRPIP